ncbi:MAG: VOC family protein [Acidimicrobiales bacterium]
MPVVSGPLVGGPIFQVVWVVADLQGAERWFSDTFAVPSWTRWNEVHFGPDRCHYRGRPADFVVDISIGHAGSQQVQLVQPTRGVSPYSDFMALHGQGLHHVSFEVDDLDATVADAVGRGMDVILRGSFEAGADFVYLDAHAAGIVELTMLTPALGRYLHKLADAAGAAQLR